MVQSKQSAVEPPLPDHLETEPLIEATFELRYLPAKDTPAELLPGIFYTQLEKYTEPQPTNIADIPRAIRIQDANLMYLPHYQLMAENLRLYIGERAVGLNNVAPYLGWTRVKQEILQILDVIRKFKFAKTIERFSFKTTDLIPGPTGEQLQALDLKVLLAGQPASESGFRLRTEIVDDLFARVLQISTNATAQLGYLKETREGLLLEIDFIKFVGTEYDFWDNVAADVDRAHQQSKELFFRLLTDDTLKALKPVY